MIIDAKITGMGVHDLYLDINSITFIRISYMQGMLHT